MRAQAIPLYHSPEIFSPLLKLLWSVSIAGQYYTPKAMESLFEKFKVELAEQHQRDIKGEPTRAREMDYCS
jgi:hypothetical protein